MKAVRIHFTNIYRRLRAAERKERIMAATQADLDAAITDLQTAVGTIGSQVQQALTDLQAKLAGVDLPVDYSGEVSQLAAAATALQAIGAAATAADPGATPAPTTETSTTPPVTGTPA